MAEYETEAETLLLACFRRFAAFAAQERTGRENMAQAQKHLYAVLGNALGLYWHTKEFPDVLDRLYKQYEVPEVELGRNPFMRLARLTLRQPNATAEVGKSQLQRCAAVLRYAAECDIQADAFLTFISEQGGMVRCARLDAENHPSPERNRAERQDRERLAKMRQCARQLRDRTLTQRLTDPGLYMVLIEVAEGGPRMLGYSPTDERGARRIPMPRQDL
ncbi:hypothetical protein [Methylobacterium sp. Leaf118]|uniref:hypothetical protein n=1 Tax=Methylobacterium sp. Leaf118 TaxID=2876562 RepID=UPI001E53044E|nr:hypothetical protein [Methylobacterium sp. Leaf118]